MTQVFLNLRESAGGDGKNGYTVCTTFITVTHEHSINSTRKVVAMSTRHVRRLQGAPQLEAEVEADVEEEAPRAPVRNAFDMLVDSQEDTDESTDESTDGVDEAPLPLEATPLPRAGDAAGNGAGNAAGISSRRGYDAPATHQRRASEQTNRRHSQQTSRRHSKSPLDSGAERALPSPPSELDVASAPPKTSQPPLDPNPLTLSTFWKLDLKHLDVSNELSKRFGKRTLRLLAAAERADAEAERNGARQRGQRQQRGAARGAAPLRSSARALFIRPPEHWPRVGGGLTMEVHHRGVAESDADAPGAMAFSFSLSRAGRDALEEFGWAVDSLDVGAIQARVSLTLPLLFPPSVTRGRTYTRQFSHASVLTRVSSHTRQFLHASVLTQVLHEPVLTQFLHASVLSPH